MFSKTAKRIVLWMVVVHEDGNKILHTHIVNTDVASLR